VYFGGVGGRKKGAGDMGGLDGPVGWCSFLFRLFSRAVGDGPGMGVGAKMGSAVPDEVFGRSAVGRSAGSGTSPYENGGEGQMNLLLHYIQGRVGRAEPGERGLFGEWA